MKILQKYRKYRSFGFKAFDSLFLAIKYRNF